MKYKHISVIAAVVMVLASGTALAAMSRHHVAGFGLFTPKLVAELHLNSAQTQALDNIHEERKALFTRLRDQRKATMASLETALKSDNPDLRSLARQRDDAMDQTRAQMRKVQDDELNLYDTLTPQQKSVVRASLLKRISSMQGHGRWSHGQSNPGSN
ncbi:MAG: Spy/CpxP family protein refolding chaperone [Gammaproteobacteria bacterium]